MSRTLIRGGVVLTMGRVNLPHADVLIDGDTIAEVGPGLRARDAEVVEAGDAIVMTGFVDGHRHLWASLFRNAGDLGGEAEQIAARLTPEDLYAATLIGLLGAVHAGVTTVVDCCPLATSSEHLDAALQAHADAGTRGVFVDRRGARARDDWEHSLGRLAGRDGGDRMVFAAGPGDPSVDALDAAAADWKAARDRGMRIHAHAGAASQSGVATALGGRGLLGPDVTLAHGSHLDDGDVAAIGSAGAAIVLTPAADMARGIPSPPLQPIIDVGIRPGLGVDTEQSSPGDVFAQMRSVISLQHATVFDRKLAGKAGLPKLLTTRDVIRYGTVDGAAAIGLGDRTGVLEPGRAADVIVLRTDRPNIHPINDPIGAVVWGMDTSNVDWVFVGGRAVKRAGQVVADVERARGLAIAAHERLSGMGVLSGAGGDR
jgi:5-methylthioadenosine/S-adenosylhomocysteine deaminase